MPTTLRQSDMRQSPGNPAQPCKPPGVRCAVLPKAQAQLPLPSLPSAKEPAMSNYVTVADGTRIFYKDWGSGQPLVFAHGWPLMMYRGGTPRRRRSFGSAGRWPATSTANAKTGFP